VSPPSPVVAVPLPSLPFWTHAIENKSVEIKQIAKNILVIICLTDKINAFGRTRASWSKGAKAFRFLTRFDWV
jgi:hypothetical protein